MSPRLATMMSSSRSLPPHKILRTGNVRPCLLLFPCNLVSSQEIHLWPDGQEASKPTALSMAACCFLGFSLVGPRFRSYATIFSAQRSSML